MKIQTGEVEIKTVNIELTLEETKILAGFLGAMVRPVGSSNPEYYKFIILSDLYRILSSNYGMDQKVYNLICEQRSGKVNDV